MKKPYMSIRIESQEPDGRIVEGDTERIRSDVNATVKSSELDRAQLFTIGRCLIDTIVDVSKQDPTNYFIKGIKTALEEHMIQL